MRYITLAAEYTGSCIKDTNYGQVDCNELFSDEALCCEIAEWNEEYKIIIPLTKQERETKKIRTKINTLDNRGIELTTRIANSIPGGAKVKYFSEGLLKLLICKVPT